jgi:hypothetical protein
MSIRQPRFPPSSRSKIFSTKIGFTVHRSNFDGRHSPPALSRGFNKSQGSFSAHPAATEPRGIRELSAAPVNLGLLRALRIGTMAASRRNSEANHEICFAISTARIQTQMSLMYRLFAFARMNEVLIFLCMHMCVTHNATGYNRLHRKNRL